MRPAPVPMPAMPSFVPTPVGADASTGVSASVASSGYGTPSAPPPAHPGPLAPSRSRFQPVPQASGPGQGQGRTALGLHAEAVDARGACHPCDVPDRFGTLGLGRSDSPIADEPRAFPWKLAAIAVGVAVIAIFVGRTYLPGRTAVSGEPGAQVEASAARPRLRRRRRPSRPTTRRFRPDAGGSSSPRSRPVSRCCSIESPSGERRSARRAAGPPDADVPHIGRRSHPKRAGRRRQDRDARHPRVLGLGCRVRADRPLRSRRTAEASDRPKTEPPDAAARQTSAHADQQGARLYARRRRSRSSRARSRRSTSTRAGR